MVGRSIATFDIATYARFRERALKLAAGGQHSAWPEVFRALKSEGCKQAFEWFGQQPNFCEEINRLCANAKSPQSRPRATSASIR